MSIHKKRGISIHFKKINLKKTIYTVPWLAVVFIIITISTIQLSKKNLNEIIISFIILLIISFLSYLYFVTYYKVVINKFCNLKKIKIDLYFYYQIKVVFIEEFIFRLTPIYIGNLFFIGNMTIIIIITFIFVVTHIKVKQPNNIISLIELFAFFFIITIIYNYCIFFPIVFIPHFIRNIIINTMNKTLNMDINLLFDYVKEGSFTVEKHKSADLYIFGYATGPVAYGKNKEWDDINKQMRGLILDSKGNIHARSFEKFFTFKKYLSDESVLTCENQEFYIGNMPYRIFDKVDGTLSILYWVNDQPFLATQRSFSSLKARKATEILYKKYKHLFPILKRNCTYIFESIYPESSVLIDYGNTEDLILIGILDNETGISQELDDIGFPLAEEYTQKLSNKNLADLESLNVHNKEGFVILFENQLRLKIKFPWYQKAHLCLDKIITLEGTIYKLERELKDELNIPLNIADTINIWERFRKGEKPEEIIKYFPRIYNIIGIDIWLQKEYDFFKKNDIIETNRNVNINKIIHNPSSELVMWNRIKRLKEQYD